MNTWNEDVGLKVTDTASLQIRRDAIDSGKYSEDYYRKIDLALDNPLYRQGRILAQITMRAAQP